MRRYDYGNVCTEYGMKKSIATLIHHCLENDDNWHKIFCENIFIPEHISTFINLCES